MNTAIMICAKKLLTITSLFRYYYQTNISTKSEFWVKISKFRILCEMRETSVISKQFWSHHSLTHWGRVTHICIVKLTIIGSDNGLSPGRCQAIIWTNAGILLIGPLGTNFNEILIGIQTFSFKKMHLKMSSAKWRPFCLGLNVLTHWHLTPHVMHEYVSGSCVDHH